MVKTRSEAAFSRARGPVGLAAHFGRSTRAMPTPKAAVPIGNMGNSYLAYSEPAVSPFNSTRKSRNGALPKFFTACAP